MSTITTSDGCVYILYVDEVLPLTRVFKYEIEARRFQQIYLKQGMNAYVWKRKVE